MSRKPRLNATTVSSLLLTIFIAAPARMACAEQTTDWPVGDATITDLLQGETEHGKFVYFSAASMTQGGCHVAKVEGERGKVAVRLDGKRGTYYRDISHPVFSPEGHSLGYCVREQDGSLVVVNQREGPKFDAIFPDTFTFSNDGKRHAYVAMKDNLRVAVIDGIAQKKDGGSFSPWLKAPVFSANSKSFGYLEAWDAQRKMRVVINGKRGEVFDGIGLETFWLSDDGSHCAYSANDRSAGNRWFMVIDDKRGAAFDALGIDFAVSPDGKRSAYAGRRGSQWFLVVNDGAEVEIEGIVDHSLIFSPDSRRLAYAVGKRDRTCYAVLDGRPGPVYSDVGGSLPPGVSANRASMQHVYILGSACFLFSPDSSRFAYIARQNGKRFVVLDGKPEEVETDFIAGGLVFSADSKRLAYGGRIASRFCLVVDGKKGADYERIGYFEFSRDGKHFALTGVRDGESFVVVDGNERARCKSVPAGPVFRADGVLEYLAVDERSLYRVEVKGF